ncbi:MAG: FkbM family methyltransferase [Candidatus Aenigmatarchaeota archaeon]
MGKQIIRYSELLFHLLIKLFTKKDEKFYLLGERIYSTAMDYKYFSINFKNKVVLDIGAWVGDSILLFHKLGAKKIIAYEPIKENFEFANKIIKKFNINCKIYPYAVCKEDGIKEFIIEEEKYGNVDLSLFENKIINPKKIKVRCVSWENVLKNAIKERVDIAKVDCEGCEKFLLDANEELIKQIPEWIIETDILENLKPLDNKFIKIGAKVKVIKTITGYYLFYSKIENKL